MHYKLILLLTTTLLFSCNERKKEIKKYLKNTNRSSRYDYEEGRNQNWLDVIVHIIPMILCWVVPILIDKTL